MSAVPQSLAQSLCYLDGVYGPIAQARVSVLDRGFLFGDGACETVPVYGRRLFRWGEHLAQFERSLARLRIANPHGRAEWLERARRLIAAQDQEEALLYLHVTRGVAPHDLAMPPDVAPTVFMMASPLRLPSPELRHGGAHGVTARDVRWERGDIRTTSRAADVLARQVSADHRATETLLFRDGHLTEGSASEVWIVHEGALLGPPRGDHGQDGPRADLLRELCGECGIACNRWPIAEADVRAADEVLLSADALEVLAVTTIDGEPVGHGALRGKPGPVYGRLYEAYQRAKRLQLT